MHHYKKFRTLFSPRRYLYSPSSLSRLPGGWGKRQWVIARSACLYKVFVLEDLPAAERGKALDIKIQQWSPFAETGRWVSWGGDKAGVWIWDESIRRKAMSDAGLKSARIIPETALQPPPEEGVRLRLVNGMEGIEAQLWKEGKLGASRWWPEVPPRDEWTRFLLANDLNLEDHLPSIQKLPWLDRPWCKHSEQQLRWTLPHKKVWWYLGAALFLFVLAWQGVAIWQWRRAQGDLEVKIIELKKKVEPYSVARAQAIEENISATNLVRLDTYPTQLELMAAVAEKLPSSGVQLVEWRYNQDHLTFTIKGQNLDQRYYVKVYQEVPFFYNVSTEKGRDMDMLIVEVNVLPWMEVPSS